MSKHKLEWGNWYEFRNKITRYIPFHEAQKALYNSDSRFLLYISGKGAGKSSFAPVWLDREIRKHPTGNFIICYPTDKIGRQGIYPEFKRHFTQLKDGKRIHNTGHNDLTYKFNESQRVANFTCGATVYFRSLFSGLKQDEGETINGIQAHAVVVDEVGLCSQRCWNIIESRVAKHQGKVLATTTPYLRHSWLKDLIATSTYYRPRCYPFSDEIRRAGDPNYLVVNAPSTVNPSFTPDEFERLKASKAQWEFEMDYCGLFSQIGGCLLPELQNCLVTAESLPQGRYIGSIDFGFGGKPSAALAGVLDVDNCLWIFYELYLQPETVESSFLTFARLLKQWHNNFHAATGNEIVWACDSANLDQMRQLKRYRLPNDTSPNLLCRKARKGQGSVLEGIGQITTKIKTGKLRIVSPYVKALIAESKEYRCEAETQKVIGEDHAIDALRYIVRTFCKRN